MRACRNRRLQAGLIDAGIITVTTATLAAAAVAVAHPALYLGLTCGLWAVTVLGFRRMDRKRSGARTSACEPEEPESA